MWPHWLQEQGVDLAEAELTVWGSPGSMGGLLEVGERQLTPAPSLSYSALLGTGQSQNVRGDGERRWGGRAPGAVSQLCRGRSQRAAPGTGLSPGHLRVPPSWSRHPEDLAIPEASQALEGDWKARRLAVCPKF